MTLKRLTLRCNNTLFALLKRKKMGQELWPCHHMSVWELMSCLAEVSTCGGHRPHRQKEIFTMSVAENTMYLVNMEKK